MKYSMDTYRLYSSEKILSFAIRVRVKMKEGVDIDVPRNAANTAVRRYPYFRKEIVLAEDGGYDLIPNGRDVVVIPTTDKLPCLCSEEVNRHMLFIDTEGRDIYFNISHSMCGGRGALPWVMTTVYEYVVEKFNVIPDALGIRKPDSDLMADKIFISFHQLIKDAKYTDAFNEVMNDLGIPFKLEGPFPKNQTKHSLPKG